MTEIVQVLSLISEALLVPVITVLLLLAAVTLFSLGGFVREALERALARGLRTSWVERAGPGTIRAIDAEPRAPDFVARFAGGAVPLLGAGDLPDRRVERLVADVEQAMTRRIGGTSILVRLGPVVGLMGTLIPMGPALKGLGAGELTALTDNLVIAFATTVLGLGIGGLAFLLSTVRTHWYTADLSDIEYLAESATRSEGDPDGEA